MNDLELYIYIALALIYFLSRAVRKKKPSQPPPRRQGSTTQQGGNPNSDGERPMTFEDLLREFTGQKEVPTNQRRVEEYEDLNTVVSEEDQYMDSEEEMVKSYDMANDGTYMSYEDVYGYSDNVKTLDEQVSLNAPKKKRFERYQVKEDENIHIAQRYRELLTDGEGIRDAIILKEILDRKYF